MKLEFDLAALAGKSEAEQKEILARVEALRAGLRLNPIWGYHPHDRQRMFHEAKARVRAFVAGNRSGKSHAGVMDDLIQCVDRDILPPWLVPYKKFDPPVYVRIITPDLTTTGEGVILDKLRAMVPPSQLLNGKWKDSYDGRRLRLSFANGSHIDFLSTGQDLDKHGGAGVHRVHFDEEPYGRKGERMWVQANIRTVDYGGDILMTMTPLEGLTWTYDVLTDDGKPIQNDQVFVVAASMYDNPYLNDEAREAVIASIRSPEERKAVIEGRWVSLEGLIYPEFSTGTHVIPMLDEIPKEDVHVFVGIDPGYRYQAAAVFAYIDRHDCITVFDEVIVEKGIVRDMTDAIKAKCSYWEVEPRWYVIDPANPTSHQTGKTDQAAYAEHGIYAIRGHNARGAGFSTIRDRLRDDPPRLLITANCENLIYQFKHYRWKKESHGEAEGKEEPVKRDDHALDALRYLVMSNPFAPKMPVEEEVLSPADQAFRDSLERINRARERHPLGGVYY